MIPDNHSVLKKNATGTGSGERWGDVLEVQSE